MTTRESLVTPDELDLARRWAASRLTDASQPSFSFTYGGQPAADLLGAWQFAGETRELDDRRTQHTLTWIDPDTGLELRCVAVTYQDYPTVEWTLRFKNTGTRDTPLLAEVQALDTVLTRPARGEFLLHSFTGSQAKMEDFQPHVTRLAPRSSSQFAPVGGRPSDGMMPYFNLEWGGQGVIMAIGWPGQWTLRLDRDSSTGLHVRGGMQSVNLSLEPGEEIRSPLIVLQFWNGGDKGGDWVRSQNVWRRWMLDHNLPRPGGKLPSPFTATCVDDLFPGMRSNAADEIRYMDLYLREGIRFDYWWIDAGWYACTEHWTQTGTWEPDPGRYPRGLKEVSDHAHEMGLKLVVWFEPERVADGTWLAEKHPEWLLAAAGARWKLLDLGNPAAWNWLVEQIDGLITSQGVDLYRQDFNMSPLAHWVAHDPPGRTGITEIKHVIGYLAYWDELLRRHPDMLIDTCASGGRRLDLETLRRSVPNTRTDYRFEPIGTQGQAHGISFWIPFSGSGVYQDSPYVMRSHMNPCFGYGVNFLKQRGDFELLRRRDAEWRQIVDLVYQGDYYPLTSYSLADDAWMAWQFDRPETGEGVVQVFRRARSPFVSAPFKLRGLDPAASYRLRDFDADGALELTGHELMETGLPVAFNTRPTSSIITYQRLADRAR